MARLRRATRTASAETEQAVLRLLSLGAASLYLAGALAHRPTLGPMVYGTWGLIWLTSLGLLVLALSRPSGTPLHRGFAIAHDTAAISIGMVVGGAHGAPLFPLYFLVALGNGLRFGTGYLYLATSFALIGYSLVIVNSPYWLAQMPLSAGLTLGLAVLPIYVAILLQQQQARMELAERANRSRSTLLAELTEELREPLHGITGMSDLLRETPLNLEQREYTDAINRAAGRLAAVAGNLEDYSRIEAGQLECKDTDFDLHVLLNGMLRMLRPQAQAKDLQLNLQIDPEIPFQLRGDAAHLRQILANLVLDAVKRTRFGGITMGVRLHCLHGPNVELSFEIEATCSGLSASTLEQVAAHRDDAEAAAALPNRSGLSVAIARRLITILGGRIEPLTATQRGTLMVFQLPFGRQPHPVGNGPTLERTRVLLVADERSANLAHLQPWMRTWQAQVDLVDTASAAFLRAEAEARRGHAYHAVVIDKPLIDIDARQFARALKRMTHADSTALVLIAPQTLSDQHEVLREAGYTCVLSSPVDKRLLFNALHSAPMFTPGAGAQVVELRTRLNRRQERAKAHILVAEDNPSSQQFITRVLERAGHRVEAVHNGEEALDALELGHYDLVVINMNVSVMDGVQTIKLHRFLHPEQVHLPFVMLTSNATPEARMECEAAGIETFLSKPVEASRLLEVVDSALRKRPHSAAEPEPLRPRKAADADDLSAGPPVLNLANLEEIQGLGYGSEFFDELMRGFIRDGNHAIEKLEDALAREDYSDFRDAAQALKSNAGTIGAVKLYKCCQQPERMSRADCELMALQLASDIGTEFRRACSALIEYSKLLGNNASS